jgi:hypothetical protein
MSHVEKDIIPKTFRKIFIFFGGERNLRKFGILIRNGTPSFDSSPIFKMLKTLGNKSFHLISHQCCKKLFRASSHVVLYLNFL